MGVESLIKISKGIIIACIITIILMLIYAGLLTYTDISENTMVPVIIAITAVSILAGSSIRCRGYKKKRNNKWRNNRISIYFDIIYFI